jgi:hypothetical protein
VADLSSLLGAAGVGGAIGKAIVSLELSTAKYQSELKGAEAQTVASTNAMGTSTSKFSGLASSALLGVGVAAVAGAAMSVGAAIEANDAHLKLQNTFENNAKLADSSVEAFEAQAGALRDLTGVDDEAIISAQALLGAFDKTGAQVQELTPLIVDLSEKYGIDLQAAAKAVGKATEGTTGSLARYVGKIEVGTTSAETYTNVLTKLSTVQGFAAKSAENEPWRVLGAQFEEIAEQIGQALLPALQNLSDLLVNILPILAKVAEAMQFLPLVQMSEDLNSDASALEKFQNGLVDTIPILGHFVDINDDMTETLGHAAAEMFIMTDHTINLASESGRAELHQRRLADAVDETHRSVTRFAHMTRKDIQEWAKGVTDSWDDVILSLEEGAKQTVITRKEFQHANIVMEREARALAQAMRDIAGEKWVNDNYIKFLSEQGPEWLIGFTKLTKEQQREAQDAWKESTNKTDQAKQSLDNITSVLEHMAHGTTKHTIIIDYRYEGFDPSKPGMAGLKGAPDSTGQSHGGPQ